MMNDPDLKISYKFAISGGNMGFQHIVQNQDTWNKRKKGIPF